MCFESERRDSAAEGWERMKKGPEYEVKCRAGGAKHATVMEDPDVLPQVM